LPDFLLFLSYMIISDGFTCELSSTICKRNK